MRRRPTWRARRRPAADPAIPAPPLRSAWSCHGGRGGPPMGDRTRGKNGARAGRGQGGRGVIRLLVRRAPSYRLGRRPRQGGGGRARRRRPHRGSLRRRRGQPLTSSARPGWADPHAGPRGGSQLRDHRGRSEQSAGHTRSGRTLAATGTLYVPDFLANAGGIINIAEEANGYDRARAGEAVGRIGETTTTVLGRAEDGASLRWLRPRSGSPSDSTGRRPDGDAVVRGGPGGDRRSNTRLQLHPIDVAEGERIVARSAGPDDTWAGFPLRGRRRRSGGLPRATASPGEQRPFGYYRITRLADGRAIGGIGFKGQPDGGCVEIGYGLAPPPAATATRRRRSSPAGRGRRARTVQGDRRHHAGQHRFAADPDPSRIPPRGHRRRAAGRAAGVRGAARPR